MTALTDDEITAAFERWKSDTRAEIIGMVEAKFKDASLNTTLDAQRKALQDIEGRIKALERAQSPIKRLKRYLGL